MADLLQKMGPLAVVAVVFAWCCWPYLSGSATAIGSKGADGAAGLPKSLLSPTIKPSNDRDPFKIVKAVAIDLLKKKLSGTADAASDGNHTEGKERAEGAARRETPLVLGGTYVQGERRMAIINGKLYRPGETLGERGAKGKLRVVKAIFPDKVLLECNGETVVLGYPDPSAPHGAARTKGADRAEQEHESPKEPSESSERDAKPVTSLSELVRALEASQKP